jgi:methylthioribose-1-phosphate isomerase
MTPTSEKVAPILWTNGVLTLLDQRLLPGEAVYVDIPDLDAAAAAIREMVVRGAPAIGITAAYAVVLAARARVAGGDVAWRDQLTGDLERLRQARPTAVNLAWAVDRMKRVADAAPDDVVADRLAAEAEAIHREEIEANRRMGELGASLIARGSGVLTHCNTGALATGGSGTALAVVRAGAANGAITAVYADETRPWLQGSRLTAWELVQEGIPVTLIADAAAAHLMKQGRIQWVIVGADRIAANGDVANKIGTYSAAVVARYHGVKFMVVAPTSTVDLATDSGADIPIETRPEDEVLTLAGRRIAPQGARAWNPAFDVTPAGLIDVIVTERGAIAAPDRDKLAAHMKP